MRGLCLLCNVKPVHTIVSCFVLLLERLKDQCVGSASVRFSSIRGHNVAKTKPDRSIAIMEHCIAVSTVAAWRSSPGTPWGGAPPPSGESTVVGQFLSQCQYSCLRRGTTHEDPFMVAITCKKIIMVG